ncbi:neurotrophin receptor-interacting factor 1-like [Megalobrama amblycephala]|uniref:neurotrophin receptor-interacting factor 1-like n=1 Tax=Megalobrama amblycephala TaxID=75352 RepID=UPI002013CE02|nr:neurotrophin receptor-interacting factor 1-like [Megalobrama amblycephala]
MQATSAAGTPFADIIASLAALHQEQHRALLDLRQDQERRFEAIVQGQQEDRERFRSWIDREVPAETSAAAAGPFPLPLQKMGPQDDPEAFLDLFEKSAEVSGWPRDQWPMRLVPLLSGESQVAAQQLPIQNLLVFNDLKRAILQRVGRSPEQHRQRFRSLELGEAGRPFVLAQQLRDSCRKWLMADGGDAEQMIDRVVLEQFTTRLPKKTAEWVQCHRPTSLDSAIQLAEDHLVACPGVGEPLPSVSLSPSLLPLSLSKPVPLPRSRPPGPPRVPPRGRGGTDSRQFVAPRAPPRGAGLATAGLDPAPASPLSPRQSFGPFSATGAAGRSGPACWRCGDPDHFIDRCPVMEVGTLIRVPDDLQVAPGQAGQYQIP